MIKSIYKFDLKIKQEKDYQQHHEHQQYLEEHKRQQYKSNQEKIKRKRVN